MAKGFIRRKLNTTMGFYSPTFMHMDVGVFGPLNDTQVLEDENSGSVFIHEFMHFIQDLTTNYGLMNICTKVDYMKFINNHIRKSPVGAFNVPVLPIPNGTDNVAINLELQGYYNGSDDDVNCADFTSDSIVSFPVTLPIGQRIVSVVKVDYTCNSIPDEFYFGAICILESMAYIIESECYPNCSVPPEIPYLSAEKLVKLVCPGFGHDRLNILALCDISLQTNDPGFYFYNTLLEIQSNNITFKYPEDVYTYCDSVQSPFMLSGVVYNKLTDMFYHNKQVAKSQLVGFFNDPYFDPIKDWLSRIVENGYNYRIANPTFPLDIARGGKVTGNQTFIDFYNKVGTPLMTNKSSDVFIYDPYSTTKNLNYNFLWAIEHIHGIFVGDPVECELLALCQKSGIGIDQRCLKTPWLRVTDLDLCPLAAMWRHWALTGYSPI